jgi:hypothetical protein
VLDAELNKVRKLVIEADIIINAMAGILGDYT